LSEEFRGNRGKVKCSSVKELHLKLYADRKRFTFLKDHGIHRDYP
jgi:hypothetical protein